MVNQPARGFLFSLSSEREIQRNLCQAGYVWTEMFIDLERERRTQTAELYYLKGERRG